MSVPGQQKLSSLRLRRFEKKRLAWALVFSLLFHAIGYGGYEFTRRVLPVWMQRIKFLAALAHELQAHKANPPPPAQPTEPTLTFVEVPPQAATTEAPKNAKFYSSQNSKAANLNDQAEKDVPKISGNQDKVPKVADAPRVFTPLQPSPAPPKQVQAPRKEQQQEEAKAKPNPPIGDLAMAKPPPPRPDTGNAEQTRPRTLVEAKMRQQQQNNLMPGEKMRQDGGVHRKLSFESLDAKATLTGAYDRAFIEAVQQRWDDLLDSRQFALDRTGKVVLQFQLTYDGRITDMHIAESTVGETLAYVCQLAVTDPAPYEKWPSDMRREIGDSRNIQFTFYY